MDKLIFWKKIAVEFIIEFYVAEKISKSMRILVSNLNGETIIKQNKLQFLLSEEKKKKEKEK